MSSPLRLGHSFSTIPTTLAESKTSHMILQHYAAACVGLTTVKVKVNILQLKENFILTSAEPTKRIQNRYTPAKPANGNTSMPDCAAEPVWSVV